MGHDLPRVAPRTGNTRQAWVDRRARKRATRNVSKAKRRGIKEIQTVIGTRLGQPVGWHYIIRLYVTGYSLQTNKTSEVNPT